MGRLNKVVALDEHYQNKALSWEDAISQDELTSSGVWALENQASVDAQTLLSLFYNEDWVYITADLLSSEFASPWLRVMREEVVAGKTTLTPAEGHPLQTLLDNPSEYADASAFWYRAGVFDCMLGNVFIWHMRANNKLFLIPAHEVQIRFDEKTKQVKEYLWQPTSEDGATRGIVVFPREEILHVMRPNPTSAHWGMSPFIAGRRSVLFNRYSSEFLNAFFEKGASPQVILETEIINSKENLATLSKSFELANSGRKNQRRPLVLPKGVKAVTIDMKVADTQLIELVNQNREVIINLLRIPKHALGLQESGSLGSEEHKTALRFMWQSTVKPMLKRYSSALTKFFKASGLLQPGFVIEFDTSEIEVATEDAQKRATLAQSMAQFFTINEIRRNVWDADPIEGGDKFVSQVVAPPQYPAPAAAPTTLSLPQEVKGISPTKPKWAGADDILKSAGFLEHVKAVDGELARTSKDMEELATNTILWQVGEALKVLKNEPLPKMKTKGVDQEELTAEIMAAVSKGSEAWTADYKKNLSTTVDLGYASQLDLVFKPQDRAALAALQEETARGRKAILLRRALESFAQISKTTTDKIVGTIATEVEQGSTLTEIARKIADDFKQIIFNRARVIARTETLTAVSIGQQNAIKNASRVIPDAKKVWITANDDRVRDSHSDVHGDVVGVNEKFKVGDADLSLPRDPSVSGHPEEVIQCRCTVAIVAPEDVDQVTGNV